MGTTIAAIRRTPTSKLSLAVVAFMLAFPIAAQSVEGTAYLAPCDRTTAGGAVFDEAPPDTGTPVNWQGGVPGADAADGRDGSLLDDNVPGSATT